MRRTVLSFFLLAAVAATAQTSQPAPHPAAPAQPQPAPKPAAPATSQPLPPQVQPQAAPNPESVPPTDAVITLTGVCADAAAAPSAACKLQVTRAEFEKLAHAMDPNL